MNEPIDPLERLTSSLPTARPIYREALRRETTRILAQRRRWRRGLLVAGSAACLVAGALAALALVSAPPPSVSPAPAPQQAVAPDAPRPADENPVALEWQAFDSPPPRRAELYLAAGDRYLEEAHDMASALRCYKQALPSDRGVQEISADDNWLVMALKIDHRQREN